MDSVKMGSFIAACRKEQKLTQAELAGQLNISDKTVSRWERGYGFPDINILEPLANVLEVSILDLVQSEKTTSEQCERPSVEADLLQMVRFMNTRQIQTIKETEIKKLRFATFWAALVSVIVALCCIILVFIAIVNPSLVIKIMTNGMAIPLGAVLGLNIGVLICWTRCRHDYGKRRENI